MVAGLINEAETDRLGSGLQIRRGGFNSRRPLHPTRVSRFELSELGCYANDFRLDADDIQDKD